GAATANGRAGGDRRARTAEHEGQSRRWEVDDERESQRGQRLGRGEIADGRLPGRPREKPDERQDEEADRNDRERRYENRRALGSHGREKPKSPSACCPAGEVT